MTMMERLLSTQWGAKRRVLVFPSFVSPPAPVRLHLSARFLFVLISAAHNVRMTQEDVVVLFISPLCSVQYVSLLPLYILYAEMPLDAVLSCFANCTFFFLISIITVGNVTLRSSPCLLLSPSVVRSLVRVLPVFLSVIDSFSWFRPCYPPFQQFLTLFSLCQLTPWLLIKPHTCVVLLKTWCHCWQKILHHNIKQKLFVQRQYCKIQLLSMILVLISRQLECCQDITPLPHCFLLSLFRFQVILLHPMLWWAQMMMVQSASQIVVIKSRQLPSRLVCGDGDLTWRKLLRQTEGSAVNFGEVRYIFQSSSLHCTILYIKGCTTAIGSIGLYCGGHFDSSYHLKRKLWLPYHEGG